MAEINKELEITAGQMELVELMRANVGTDLTVHDYAAQLDVKHQSITGRLNGLVKRGFADRVEGSIELEDGKEKAVKFLVLTDAGLNADFSVKA